MDLRHSRATLLSLGAVDTSGTPAANQVARFFDADTVQGSANFTFSGTILALTGNMTISSFLAIGAIPSATGELRLSNADSINFRNFADDGDHILFSFSDSDVFQFATSLVLETVFNSPLNTFQGIVEIETGGSPFRVATGPGAATTLLEIESTLRTTTLNSSLVIKDDVTVAGQAETEIQFSTTLLATPSGLTATAAGLIPAGAMVLGITVRVQSTVTGPAGFDIGDGVNTDRWGNSIAVALGTQTTGADFVSSALEIFPVANDVVLTSDGVAFTGGAVRVSVHYISLAAPTG